jgi:hypothetical protein
MSSKNALRNTLLPIAAITLGLFLLLDFVAGAAILGQLSQLRDLDARFRVGHDVYHHTLRPNYDGPAAWGSHTTHRLCTNEYGFKIPCAQHGPAPKSYDMAFIGDSYTEGVGLPYEDTFVGRIAAQLPDKSIVNLGVVSYAPSIYLAKIRYLLDQGFRFKQVMVYVDISDIQDEAAFYRYDAETGAVLDMDPNDPDGSLAVPRLKRWIKRVFPLTFQAYWWTAELTGANRFDYTTRSLWTIDIDAKGYGAMGAAASVDKSVRLMTELHALLKQHGIGMSVGIYPWPRTLRHDHVDSRQVKVWQSFCEQRCEYFFNSFPSFFRAAQDMGTERVIEALFIPGDSHHLPAGAELIARDFLAQYRRP